MKVTVVRSLTIAGLFAGAPFLLGANGSGCQAPPLVSDAGADATPPACVSTENGPCGAFIAQPCTCAAGLECVGQTMSGAGTCLPPKDAGAEDAAIDDAAPDALGSAVDASPPDSSGCLSASDCPVNSGAACASVCADGTNPCVNACVAGACVERGCPDSAAPETGRPASRRGSVRRAIALTRGSASASPRPTPPGLVINRASACRATSSITHSAYAFTRAGESVGRSRRPLLQAAFPDFALTFLGATNTVDTTLYLWGRTRSPESRRHP